MLHALICDLRRLWPTYGDGSRVHFSLNLATGVITDGEPVRGNHEPPPAALLPWTWDKIREVQLFVFETRTFFLGTVDDPPDLLAGTDLDALRRTAEQGIGSSWSAAWTPAPATVGENGGERDLPGYLGYLSTWPAPLPHSLQLTLLFTIRRQDLDAIPDGARLLAVPIRPERRPREEESAISEQGGLWRWEYEPGAIDLRAHLRPWVKSGPPSPGDSLIDPSTLWIRKGVAGVAESYSEDWVSMLESRVGVAFDLAQRLIDVMRDHLGSPELLLAPASHFRRAVLAALRDLAGVGLERGPDGGSLAEELLRGRDVPWRVEEVRAVLESLRRYDRAFDFAGWLRLLRAELPDQAAALRDPDRGWDPPRLVEELGQLEDLQSALAGDAVLRRVVLAQWREALAGSTFWNVHARALEERLNALPVRTRLERANLGIGWRRVVSLEGQGMQVEALAERLRQELLAYLRGRLVAAGDPTAEGYEHRNPRPGVSPLQLPVPVVPSLERFARELVTAHLLPDAAPGAERQPTRVPHPVALQVDRLAGLDPADEADFLRQISGVGVLMRNAGGAWRCLNLATLQPAAAQAPLSQARPVPTRLHYRNGLRQTVVTYDNQPLVARSPAVDLAKEEGHTGVTNFDPLLRFGRPGGLRLPALKFGQDFEVLLFAVSSSGALPAELAGGHPTQLVNLERFNADALRDRVRTVRYRRRVQVGPPRVAPQRSDVPAQELEPLRLPPLPETVSPLFRDLPSRPEVDPETPLLLLAPGVQGRQRFRFWVRKPATDLNTWERWVAAAPAQRQLREDVWADFHRQAPLTTDPPDPRLPPPADRTLDDPAVNRHLSFRLRRLDGPADPVVRNDVVVRDPVGDKLKAVQSPPLEVVCEIGASGIRQVAGENKVTVTVPEGQVWELSIHPQVPEADFRSRFSLEAPEQPRNPPAGMLLLAPLRLAIEVATPALPGPTDLWRALQPRFDGASALVHLDPRVAVNLRWLKRIELERQLWRWDGRSLDVSRLEDTSVSLNPDPITQEVTPAMLWEASSFADRRDGDVTVLGGLLALDAVSTLHAENLAHDPRALYFRFSARAWSRYQGLFPGNLEVQAGLRLTGPGQPPLTRWRRLFVPARWPAERPVPKPLVKLVLPLTEAGPDSARAADLLVVLNEPWYQVGGLAEHLEAEISAVEVANPGGGTVKLPEAGADPILSMTPLPAVAGPTVLQPVSHFGHTFDTDTDAPLFVATSFILPAPASGRDFSWHFARVRFQRVLRRWALAGGAGPLRSAPTDLQWVQYLPDSRRGMSVGTPWDDLRLWHDGDLFKFCARGSEQAVPLHPLEHQANPVHRFRLWVVLTRRIEDAFGRPDQELYLGLYEIEQGTRIRPLEPWSGALPAEGLRARVLEIQERIEPAPSPASPWKLLFPDEPDRPTEQGTDARARIVRISRPVGMEE